MLVEDRCLLTQAKKLQRLRFCIQQHRYGYATQNFRYWPENTHFLHIPLASSDSSRTQLLQSRAQLMRDPVTKTFPKQAFVLPASQNIVIGKMTLAPNERLEAAKALLQSLDLETILKESREKSRSATSTGTGAILASVVGLERAHLKLSSVQTLFARVIDEESILPKFLSRIQKIFHQAGLLYLGQYELGEIPLHVKLINTNKLYTLEVIDPDDNKKHLPKALRCRKNLTVDSRMMFQKFQDFVWADDIQLQKVSISEARLLDFRLELKDRAVLADQGYHEVASVLLPGASCGDPVVYPFKIGTKATRCTHKFSPRATYDVTCRGQYPSSST